ncbi:MAG: hypothetical protein PHQ36_09520 [Anaerolineales bacterium]|nr:hypothetical protein [Anaerolineales bacterium]
MLRENRFEFSFFFLLILIGGWFMFDRFIPEFHAAAIWYTQWPGVLILLGAAVFLFGALLGAPDMFAPAIIIWGIGKILAYQQTRDMGFDSWYYLWTLIPGFVGTGMFASGLFDEESKQDVKRGFVLIVASAILFAVFGALFGALKFFD